MPLEPEDAPGEAGGAVTGPVLTGPLWRPDAERFPVPRPSQKKSRGRNFTYFTILVFLTHRYLLV